MFKSLEDPSKAPPMPERAERNRSTSTSSSHGPVRVVSQSRGYEGDEAVYDGRLDQNRSYDCAPEAGEFENDPVYNDDVVRESDQLDEAELPERGTTRGLLAKFQMLQQTKN